MPPLSSPSASSSVRRSAGALVLLGLVVGVRAAAETSPPDPLAALDSALAEASRQLATIPEPAYYVALALAEERETTIQATHGALAGVAHGARRIGDVDLRVGSMALDNTHKLRDASFFSRTERTQLSVPFTDAVVPLRNGYLRTMDDAYRSARELLIKIRANEAVKVERQDDSADFSVAPVVVDRTDVAPAPLDTELWKGIVRDASAIYLEYPNVYDSAVQVTHAEGRDWLATTEGTRIATGRHHYRVATWGSTVADDGMQVQVYDYVDVASLDHLPDRAAVLTMARAVAQRVSELRRAPVVEPYAGPAILRGRAAGVFFHEIFGHRVEGHRQKDDDEGQTFTSRVGQAILPDFLSVEDDPTLARIGTFDLNGHYRYDDEGVPAERVELVVGGVLRNFLMSRSPVAGFPRSNGHGRRQPGAAPVARQGNLIVRASRSVSYPRLREQLVAEVKKQGKPFGLVFDDISGGFTFTGRSEPNAFVVNPVTVWKVYPDGRPDQLVRGVDLIGTPLTTFSRILAAADDTDVFNGVCGAESGWVPVSAVAPSLLVSEVEVQRHEKANDRPPLLLPPPGVRPVQVPS